MEAVAVGHVPGGRVEQRRRHHVLAEEHHEPVHRAHEQRTARAPVHAARDRQRIERAPARCPAADPRRARRRWLPMKKRNVPLPSCSCSSASTATPQLAANASAARVGSPAASKAALSGRSLALQVLLRLAVGEALHPHGQAPRGRVAGEFPVAELGLVEPGGKRADERLLQGQQRPRRQFLGADLQQEIVMLDLHARAAGDAAPASCSSGKPSASRLS